MTTIPISDNAGLSADLQIRTDSPLATAGLSQIHSTGKSIVANLSRPVDQTDIGSATFGFTLQSPSIPISKAAVVPLAGGVSASLRIVKPQDGPVFAGDPFSPDIPTPSNSVWTAIELDTTLGANAAAAIDGFGVGVDATRAAALTTYCLLKSEGGQLPTLREAIQQALSSFSIACTVESLTAQQPGTIYVSGVSGSLTVSGTYSLPVNINALASANLPFHFDVALQPKAALTVGASITVSGEFIIRSYKPGPTQLILGVYKKKGTQVIASLSAGAGLQVAHEGTDLITELRDAIGSGPTLAESQFSASQQRMLNEALTAGMNRSLSVSMNMECAAAQTHEAAVIYSVDLTSGDPASTAAAFRAALHGDWTLLGTIKNAHELRNIVKATNDIRHSTAINFLGIYNAATVGEFLKSCTILHDDSGQIVVTDSVTAREIATTAVQFGADDSKLRKALAEAFMATVSYIAAAAGTKPELDISVAQSYLHYDADVSTDQLRKDVLLGYALELIPGGSWDETLASKQKIGYGKASVESRYDKLTAMRLFFSDVDQRIPHVRANVEKVGRETLASLISGLDDIGRARITALQSDAVWNKLTETGNMSSFATLDVLKGYSRNAIADIAADWASITWWADAITKVVPALQNVLAAADKVIGDLSKDRNFMKSREALAAAIGNVSKKSSGTFTEGWGLAANYTLSGRTAPIEMDLSAGARKEHYEAGKALRAGEPQRLL